MKGIQRMRMAADTEMGLSHLPHVILNQAGINGMLIGVVEAAGGCERGVEYGVKVTGVEIDEARVNDQDTYHVSVKMERDGKVEIVKAKYVLACDGAHSATRKSLGIRIIGDSTNNLWGVMDIYPLTNFPDIRRKCVLQCSAGSIVIIPCEGGSLCRLYIELEDGTKDVTLESLQDTARRIFCPFALDFAKVSWWSVYSIGQRLAERFSQSDRVFLTGDACHTHSPKAGQGMNVSLQDGYNIGWKLAMALKGQASLNLIKTYSEREKVAADLIEFDRTWAQTMSSKNVHGKNRDFRDIFVQAGKYTAGLETKYEESINTRAEWSNQDLARGCVVGLRFPSTRVVRHCDGKIMQLAKTLPSDGRWRIVVFAGVITDPRAGKEGAGKLQDFANFMTSESDPAKKHTTKGTDVDSFIDPILVLRGCDQSIKQDQIPDYFRPPSGKWQMRDLHKAHSGGRSHSDGNVDPHELYRSNIEEGAGVIVRPDQYVSLVVGLDDHDVISRFFDGFVLQQ